MDHSHMPLLTWFYGVFITTTLTPGISAVQFQKVMGLSRYETAFQMLHKIRHAMVNPERDLLHGVIQVDETYMGGVRVGGKGGRSLDDKTLVVGAVEVRVTEKKPQRLYAGHVRFRVVDDAGSKNLAKFVKDNVTSGSVIYTDGWKGYNKLAALGYDHRPTLAGDEQSIYLKMIHLEFSNLKTDLRGTYHGRVEEQHLQTYLNEFAFRHNRRFFDVGFPFLRVLQFGMQGRPPTQEQFYDANEYGTNVHMAGLVESDCPCEGE